MSSRIFSCTSGWSMTLIGVTTAAPAFPLAAPFGAGAFFTVSAEALACAETLMAPFFSVCFEEAGVAWPLVPLDFADVFFGSGAAGALALLVAGVAFFSGFLGSRVF